MSLINTILAPHGVYELATERVDVRHRIVPIFVDECRLLSPFGISGRDTPWGLQPRPSLRNDCVNRHLCLRAKQREDVGVEHARLLRGLVIEHTIRAATGN